MPRFFQKPRLSFRRLHIALMVPLALLIGVSWRIAANANAGKTATDGANADSVVLAAADVATPDISEVSSVQRERPRYKIDATIDFDLLTFKSSQEITVPVAPGDSMRDVVFFLFANASGVGGTDEKHRNVAVDRVSLDGKPIPHSLNGAVLRVPLPRATTSSFTLNIETHGVVPRSAPGSGTLADMMGGMGADLGDMLGGLGGLTGGAKAEESKPKNTDYGLYTYGNGVLSLGSFWYPSLAVRQNGKWIDAAPQGLGDVAYSEMSDFEVVLAAPEAVTVVAPGIENHKFASYLTRRGDKPIRFLARNVRDFAVLMSEDFQTASKDFKVGSKTVKVEAYTTTRHASKAAQAIDVAGHALQIFSKRFGNYPYTSFKIVEGPMRGGAGGMEYSGMTSIASMLYDDWGKQLQALSGSLGAGDLGKMLDGLGLEDADMSTHAADAGTKSDAKTDEAKSATASKDNDEPSSNPASDFLRDTLGGQKAMLDSIFETTIAHEVAHQWWAIGVGSDSQRAPFVDESLTNYCAMLYYEDRYGAKRAAQMSDIHLRTTYSMTRTLGQSDARADLATAGYKNNLQYGAIVYGKGALYYDALRKEVGDAVFFDALRDYYARYRNRLASPRALLQIVQQKAPAKSNAVATLFKRWIEETHGDDDITGGKPMSINDLLGGMLGGASMNGTGDE